MELPMLKKYREEVVPALKAKFGYENVHQVPRIEKIVLNSSFGKAEDRKAASADVIADLGVITGQKAVATRSKTSISNFKLREGDVVGARLTLRGRRMWEFIDRFFNIAIPTIRDFRGLSSKTFDGRGNFTCGIADHTIFPEIELDKVKRTIGFDCTIVTTATSDDHARELLTLLGLGFRKPSQPVKTGEGTDAPEADAA
ncbi:MAG: 50S ribosomal protein L5 [Akkermansiaceae bacterium]|nr:50S ribosomal protein L5 [Akkermansiaceae bacterium]